MSPNDRELSLASLLLKLGVALENADSTTAADAHRELALRFGVTVSVPLETQRRIVAGRPGEGGR